MNKTRAKKIAKEWISQQKETYCQIHAEHHEENHNRQTHEDEKQW